MKITTRWLLTCLHGMVCLSPMSGLADAANQPVQPKHPAKAASNAPLSKPLVLNTAAVSPAAKPLVKPRKPEIATAVAPKGPVAPGTRNGIIFVGGKPNNGDSALNTQPIPPGRPLPSSRIRKDPSVTSAPGGVK